LQGCFAPRNAWYVAAFGEEIGPNDPNLKFVT